MSLILFQVGDSLIAFKNLLVYCFGVFAIIMIKIIYRSERPFWNQASVNTVEGKCQFDFALPSQTAFNLVFYWTYNILMYFTKYTEKVNYYKVFLLMLIQLIYYLAISFTQWIFGVTYLFQQLTTGIISILYVILALSYDNEMLDFSEKLGFIVRSSR
jgi:hypothetical protein